MKSHRSVQVGVLAEERDDWWLGFDKVDRVAVKAKLSHLFWGAWPGRVD